MHPRRCIISSTNSWLIWVLPHTLKDHLTNRHGKFHSFGVDFPAESDVGWSRSVTPKKFNQRYLYVFINGRKVKLCLAYFPLKLLGDSIFSRHVTVLSTPFFLDIVTCQFCEMEISPPDLFSRRGWAWSTKIRWDGLAMLIGEPSWPENLPGGSASFDWL